MFRRGPGTVPLFRPGLVLLFFLHASQSWAQRLVWLVARLTDFGPAVDPGDALDEPSSLMTVPVCQLELSPTSSRGQRLRHNITWAGRRSELFAQRPKGASI